MEKTMNKKEQKNGNKILLIIMLILLVLEIVLIPCMIYAEVKRLLPIVAFLIVPTVLGIIVLWLSRNCTVDYENKKSRLSKKV